MDLELEASLRKFEATDDEILDHIPSATAPYKEGWSDDHLRELRVQYKFPDVIFTRAELKRILARFYDFYFSGTIRPGDSLAATVCDMVGLATTSYGTIWKPSVVGRLFYKPNTSLGETINQVEPRTTIQLIMQATAVTTEQQNKYEAKRFKDLVKTLLRKIQADGVVTKEETTFIRMSSFLAVSFFRAAIKNQTQMTNVFLKKQFRLKLATITDWSALPWAPPCERCIKEITRGLIKGTPCTSAIFTILAHEFTLTQKTDYKNPGVAEFLNEAVLMYTANNGLGMIQMIEQVTGVLDLNWKMLRNYTLLDKTLTSWRTIDNFYKTFALKGRLQYGYRWARIIDDGYLRGFSPKENMFLAVIFAGVLEKCHGDGVWRAEWIKGKIELYASARHYGNTLYQRLDQLKLAKQSTVVEPDQNGTKAILTDLFKTSEK
ncbi:uncharacterized protein LOC114879997 [Osmia bicornis bicornis]|uniref:uncharacterized protein LOC114879997 n=1 Tax=Osmia bicornis bicornis TaxID=1437191 RepID=UPI001EAF03F6|nr:uncharacterized protein LOC114879997 [Osmia bicornis bicornis]